MQLYRENEFAGAASITDCDKEKVTNMLLYHIVDGEYSSYGQLQVEPMFVLTNAERREWTDDNVCMEKPMAGCSR